MNISSPEDYDHQASYHHTASRRHRRGPFPPNTMFDDGGGDLMVRMESTRSLLSTSCDYNDGIDDILDMKRLNIQPQKDASPKESPTLSHKLGDLQKKSKVEPTNDSDLGRNYFDVSTKTIPSFLSFQDNCYVETTSINTPVFRRQQKYSFQNPFDYEPATPDPATYDRLMNHDMRNQILKNIDILCAPSCFFEKSSSKQATVNKAQPASTSMARKPSFNIALQRMKQRGRLY